MRAWLAMVGALGALVAGGLLLAKDGDDDSQGRRASAAARQVPRIARRVEAIRGLRFRRRPVPRVVSTAQARREGLSDLDRHYPERARRADEEILKLLGLLEPDDDIREIAGSLFGGEVAGFYDTRRKRLALVREAAGTDEVTAEVTLAHELTHALEDQRFGIEEPAARPDDAVSAYEALVEGTATALMTEYTRRHVSAGDALGSALGALGASDLEELPAYVVEASEFSYLGGERFVESLVRFGKGWRLVNFALDRRPPASTEQIIHPRKYVEYERPLPVRLRVAPLLGRAWRRVAAGTLGEFDTEQIVRRGPGRPSSREAAAGWGGARYELWRRGPLPAPGCRAPCRSRDVLVLAWAWDSGRDADEFAQAARVYVEKRLKGRAALRSAGRAATLAIAPSPAQAARIAQKAQLP